MVDDLMHRAWPWALTLVLHNWPIMLYSVLIGGMAVWTYQWPTRRAVLVLYGLLLLAFAFEYQKHFAAVLVRTTDYLFSVQYNPELRAVSRFLLMTFAPIGLHAAGVACFICAARLPRPAGSSAPARVYAYPTRTMTQPPVIAPAARARATRPLLRRYSAAAERPEAGLNRPGSEGQALSGHQP